MTGGNLTSRWLLSGVGDAVFLPPPSELDTLSWDCFNETFLFLD